jgi:hypothetical protein
MYIERVAMTGGDPPTLREAVVGSELFVPVDDLTREDRLWLGRRLGRAVTAWLGAWPTVGDVVLTDAAGDGALALSVDGLAAPPFEDLPDDARLLVRAAITDFLDLVQGCLIIAPEGRAITRRKGDAPA